MLNFDNVIQTIRNAKEYHTQQKQRGGVTDEYRLKHIALEEEYSIAEKALSDMQFKEELPPQLNKHDVSGRSEQLPTVQEAGAAAVAISENVKPSLSASEQSLFVAGFQECVKWLGYSGNCH